MGVGDILPRQSGVEAKSRGCQLEVLFLLGI
jgi:hypothetical protein